MPKTTQKKEYKFFHKKLDDKKIESINMIVKDISFSKTKKKEITNYFDKKK